MKIKSIVVLSVSVSFLALATASYATEGKEEEKNGVPPCKLLKTLSEDEKIKLDQDIEYAKSLASDNI